MGGGNGAKAQKAREKNAKDNAVKGSQLKANAAAQTTICSICRQTFQSTTKKAGLQTHVDGKHSGKTFADCFPTYTGA